MAPLILVAEDDRSIRDFLVMVLEDEGYTVGTAVDGLEALTKVALARPGLMLLDLAMPRMSGLEVLWRLHADASTLKVIVVSANVEAFREARELGAMECLPKPFDLERLLHCVQQALGV